MLKGILEGCILHILTKEETYGYELKSKLDSFGFLFVSKNSIYPVLSRLQKEGLIVGQMKKSLASGPDRKYYQLTQEGLERLKVFYNDWSEVSEAVNCLINDVHSVKLKQYNRSI